MNALYGIMGKRDQNSDEKSVKDRNEFIKFSIKQISLLLVTLPNQRRALEICQDSFSITLEMCSIPCNL